jgi:hypothetical protein
MSADSSARQSRRGERVEILGELRGEVMVLEEMAVREIGPGGAQIETRVPLQLDSLHTFRLTLGDRSIVVKGRVVHCRVADVEQDAVVYRAGVEFIEPSSPVTAAIDAFLQMVKAARNGAH